MFTRLLSATCLFFALAALAACNEDDSVTDILSGNIPVTDADIVQGLKTALNQGTDTSVATLNKTNGYWQDLAVRILLPPQAQNVYNAATTIPGLGAAFSSAMDDFQLKMNRAAEDAAAKAKPIFVEAITDITITDGINIVKGDSLAATSYLKTSTYANLTSAFKPDIQASLEGVGAQQAWNTIVGAYNPVISTYNTAQSLLGGQTFALLPADLSLYVTERALDGLFQKVGAEEKRIRRDPLARVKEILRRVFALQD